MAPVDHRNPAGEANCDSATGEGSSPDTFRHFVEHSPFGIYAVDAEFRLAHVSAGATKIFATAAPLVRRDLVDVLRAVWREPFVSEAITRFRHTIATGAPQQFVSTAEHRNGASEVEAHQWCIERIVMPDGHFGVLCHLYDWSERRRAEKALEEKSALAVQLSKTADSAPGLICSFRLKSDGTASFPYAAARMLDLYGIAPEQVREDAGPLFARIHPEDAKVVREAIATSARDMCDWHAEFRYDHPAKGEIWIEGHSSPVREPGGSVVWHGYIQDITERKRVADELARMNAELESRVLERTTALEVEIQRRAAAQVALAQSQRLEAVGRLAGGLAHDFNNALTAISANLELAEMRIQDPVALEALRRALDAVELSANLNRRLLTFAPRGKSFRDTVPANARVASLITLLERTLGADVRFEADLYPALWPTSIDPVELDSALLNLAINARDAMPEGGVIRIETSNVTISADRPDNATPPGDYVRVSMIDCGTGMAPDILHKATQPFFTTKKDQRNAGLGLSSVREFAESCGGAVAVESSEGHGTTVSLYLPRSPGAAPVAAPHKPGGDTLPLGDGELVLLVEDNVQVLQTTHVLLEGLGYAVLDAADGVEALAVLKEENGAEIDLVLSDVVMPGGISGYDVARFVLAQRPRTRVVLTSGFNSEQQARDNVLDKVSVLRKPFTRAQLASELRKALATNILADETSGAG